METITQPEHLTDQIQQLKAQNQSVGFVPTMGALHEGHMALIEKARKANDVLVVSIFVNPTQFDDPDDYRNYPSTQKEDQQKLQEANCDLLFMPTEEAMYPEGKKMLANFDPGPIAKVLEGEYRPGHFQGVATIVKKLFDVAQPHRAYFGLKDYQQLLIIQKLVADLEMGIDIIPVPIVRESDGLAKSSRNVLLTEKEREIAPVIYQTLQKAATALQSKTPVPEIQEQAFEAFHRYPELDPEYFEIRDALTLDHVSNPDHHAKILICTAVYLGKVRLIDNLVIQ